MAIKKKTKKRPSKKRLTKKRSTKKSGSRKPSGLKLPRELWTMSDAQIKDTVAYLAKLPEPEIRRRQDLNVATINKAWNMPVGDLRNRGLGNGQADELLLQAAMLKKDGDEPIVSFERLRRFYGGDAEPMTRERIVREAKRGHVTDAHIQRSPELNKFLNAYIVAALWSSNDESNDSGGEPLDANYSRDDLTPECLAKMVDDCERFVRENKAALKWATNSVGYDWGSAGHDFWLTRNGHGAGFWDRKELSESLQEKLTAAAKKFGESYLSVSDGKVYCD